MIYMPRKYQHPCGYNEAQRIKVSRIVTKKMIA